MKVILFLIVLNLNAATGQTDSKEYQIATYTARDNGALFHCNRAADRLRIPPSMLAYAECREAK